MYAWQQPYFEAVLESDEAMMPHHLMEALASIEQRLLSPIDRDSDEFQALQNTWFDIQELLTERRNGSGDDECCAVPV
jgi:7,8-dihydro-6-hydroxymethylpterin-pyrophosphokinase